MDFLSFYDQRRLELAEKKFFTALDDYSFKLRTINDISEDILKEYYFYEEREFGETRKRILNIDFLYNLADKQYEEFYKKRHEILLKYDLANPKGWEFCPCEEEAQKLKEAKNHLFNVVAGYIKKLETIESNKKLNLKIAVE